MPRMHPALSLENALYYEDFEVGQKIETETFSISLDKALEFAREYDPQYYHTDEEAAGQSMYGKLIVSGWQTAAITMRLKATSRLANIAGGLLGLGVESLRWPKPVYPGDTLRTVLTIVEKRPSKSKPTHGVMKYRMETFNQNDELVLEVLTSVWVPRRP